MAPHSSTCRSVLAVPRALVSQNKRRFQQDGFDLDLAYVHPRIIVMGYPAVGMEFLFRNPRSEVQQLLDERHDGNYFVYNFCDESKRSYASSVFAGRVKHFPIEDHNVPSFQTMTTFCEEAAAWLYENENHVVVLHCKAGKGRAGMMACMLLLRMGFSSSATEAIELYNRERVHDRCGLTVQSQKKWVNYYAALLAQNAASLSAIQEPAFVIKKLAMVNTLTAAKPSTLRLRIFTLRHEEHTKVLLHQQSGLNEFYLHEKVRGCVLLEFYRERVNGCLRAKHFKIWFHTGFLNPDSKTGRIVFSRLEMDCRDKRYRLLPAAFELEMTVMRLDH
ncbi:hypothetical protein CCR75_001433 [Bremia lactucae]|uniref:Phosphatidylinositol-3,4,5-trisphosphate 3-phosphatase n=1 Tax=Bremia lactucae TaxID=4779 RepID=A0A976FKG9_BRELC|nr:hypothetical protein CCR75_001433 [Bremia lactucae]